MGKRSEIYKLVYAKIIEGYPISTFFCTFWIAFTQQHYNLQHSQGYFHCPRLLNLQSWSFLLFCFSKQPQKLMLKFDIERLQRMPPLVTSNFLRVHQKIDLHPWPVLSFYCLGKTFSRKFIKSPFFTNSENKNRTVTIYFHWEISIFHRKAYKKLLSTPGFYFQWLDSLFYFGNMAGFGCKAHRAY